MIDPVQARLAPMSLLAGVAAAVASVVVYQQAFALALAAATSLLVLLIAPAGVGSRLPYGLGFVSVVAMAAVPRGEGDYLVASTTSGYLVLGLALLVLTLAVGTLPRSARQSRSEPAESARRK